MGKYTAEADKAKFQAWLSKVDGVLIGRIGLTHSDLADFASWDCWASGASPEEGAQECLDGDDLYAGAGF